LVRIVGRLPTLYSIQEFFAKLISLAKQAIFLAKFANDG